MIALLFSILLILGGCGPSTPDPIPSNPDFKEDIKPILLNRCMSCHSEGFKPHGSSTNWIDENTFKNSLDKVEDRVLEKKDMPRGSSLTPRESELIRRYIENNKDLLDDPVTMLILMDSMF